MAEQRSNLAVSAPTHPEEGVIQRLTRQLRVVGIVLHNADEIGAYVESHSGMAAGIASLCENARSQFPPPTELVLGVYHDPDVVDEEYLTLYVRPPEYRDGLGQRIEEFASSQDELFANGANVLVTTDFRLPGESHVVRVV
jgi:hypothetical protein